MVYSEGIIADVWGQSVELGPGAHAVHYILLTTTVQNIMTEYISYSYICKELNKVQGHSPYSGRGKAPWNWRVLICQKTGISQTCGPVKYSAKLLKHTCAYIRRCKAGHIPILFELDSVPNEKIIISPYSRSGQAPWNWRHEFHKFATLLNILKTAKTYMRVHP